MGQGSERQLSLSEHLSRPCCRVDDYITILQDLLRYTAKAEQDTGRLEQAIEMMMQLKKHADDLATLDRLVGYPGDLSLLGPIYRHVSRTPLTQTSDSTGLNLLWVCDPMLYPGRQVG